jgi:hydrogenase expression/formation protein HypC
MGGAVATRRARLVCLAVPGRILSISGDDALTRVGRVDFGGVIKEVNLIYVPEAQPGQYVLVHVGFALAVIDEAEAGRVFGLLRQLEEPAAVESKAT